MAIRIVLAEDNYLVREGVRRLLEKQADLEVVATCHDLDSLLEAVETERPDVVLTDIRMPPPHVHGHHVESFYVLEGELALIAGGREFRAQAGSWVQVPPGVRHSVRCGSEPARLLDLHTPNCGFGACMRAFYDDGDEQEPALARSGFDQL